MNIYRLLCQIAATPNATLADAELVFAMLDEISQINNELKAEYDILIEYDRTMDFVDSETNMTALMHAAAQGNTLLVEFLLKKGSTIDFVTDKDSCKTALYYAAMNNRLETAKILIERGANPFVGANKENTKDSAVAIAAAQNHFGMVQALTQSKWVESNRIAIIAAAMVAVERNNSDPVEWLFDLEIAKAKLSKVVRRETKNTPLHLAVLNHANPTIINYLLRKDPSQALCQDADGFIPLELAAMENNLSAVYLLTRPESQVVVDNLLNDRSVQFNKIVTKFLTTKDDNGVTPIIYYLLLKAGAIVDLDLFNIIDNSDHQLADHFYYFTCVSAKSELWRMIDDVVDFSEDFLENLKTGGMPRVLQLEFFNAFKKTDIYDEASEHAQFLKAESEFANDILKPVELGVAKTFEQFCLSFVSKSDASVAESQGSVPKGTAPSNIFSDFLLKALIKLDEKTFLKLYADLKQRIKKGKGLLTFGKLATRYKSKLSNEWMIHPDYNDQNGRNVFRDAILQGKNDVVKLLIKKGVNVDLSLLNRDTPILFATRHKNSNAVKQLIAADASTSATDSEGNNCLLLATMNDDLSLIELFSKHCPLDSTNEAKLSALGCALIKGKTETIEKLFNVGVKFKDTDWHNVTQKDSLSSLQYLIESEKCEMTEQRIHFVLFSAATNSALECLKYLLKKYKNEIDFKAIDNHRESLLQAAKKSSLPVFELLLSKSIPFSIENSSSNTICDDLVEKAYSLLSLQDPLFTKRADAYRPYVNHETALALSYNNKETAKEAIERVYTFLNNNPKISTVIVRLNWLFINETDKNRLTYSDFTQKRLSAIRRYMVAGLRTVLEYSAAQSESKAFELADRIQNKMESFKLEEVLNFHDMLPDFLRYFFKSETIKTAIQIVSQYVDPNKDKDSEIMSTRFNNGNE